MNKIKNCGKRKNISKHSIVCLNQAIVVKSYQTARMPMISKNKKPSGSFSGTNISTRRIFTSKDPLVGELSTNIESVYSGMVIAVNKIINDPTTGKIITDFDIETDNAVIQVKSGGGKGLTTQMKNTSTATSKEVIAYGPKLKPSVIKSVEATEYKVFTTEEELINYLGVKTTVKTLILITENPVTFELLKDTIGKKFHCSEVLDNRLTIESASDHLFIDFDDNIKDDYDESEIKNSDSHFFAVLYNSEEFVRNVLKELSTYQIRVDDDDGTVLPIKSFLNLND